MQATASTYKFSYKGYSPALDALMFIELEQEALESLSPQERPEETLRVLTVRLTTEDETVELASVTLSLSLATLIKRIREDSLIYAIEEATLAYLQKQCCEAKLQGQIH